MHRSRLAQVLLDVPGPQRDTEERFWSAALNLAPQPDPDDPEYTLLGEPAPGLHLIVQEVDSPARAHLDIETDDIEAEVSRLCGLGAEVVARVKRWVVMRDPAGLLFCVIRVHTAAFDRDANMWPD
ncbi:MAG: VOC family protein [Pseudonocardiaceae bacterium]